MIARLLRAAANERRATVLAVIIIAQSLCAMFFLADVIFDVLETGRLSDLHIVVEAIAAVALIGGVAYLMLELRHLLGRMEQMETGLRIARGEVVQIIEAHFEQWRLSPAERDVALLLLKGVDNETIASMRGTAKGTVRAQSAAIYTKAGVDGRAQLISLFLDELLAEGISGADTPA